MFCVRAGPLNLWRHGISAMPTFQFFNKGEKQSELVGASEVALKERLENLAKA